MVDSMGWRCRRSRGRYCIIGVTIGADNKSSVVIIENKERIGTHNSFKEGSE